jgi:hypothetical protein
MRLYTVTGAESESRTLIDLPVMREAVMRGGTADPQIRHPRVITYFGESNRIGASEPQFNDLRSHFDKREDSEKTVISGIFVKCDDIQIQGQHNADHAGDMANHVGSEKSAELVSDD